MWLGYYLLGLVSAVANEVTQGNISVQATIEETMLKHRCVPTAVTRGPCHVCSCSSRGAYQCHSETCVYEEKDNIKPDQPECEPDMLYNEGALWCLCDARGFWRSSNCRSNFRSVRHKSVTRLGPALSKDIPCENGSIYAVDCNVCECRAANLTVDACTNRTCAAGTKEDPCKLGQLVRADQQLCACSQIGYYVNDLCINLPTNEKIQKISKEDLAKLNYENPSPANTTCEPYSIIQQDCNSCSCTASGHLTCTSKLCLSDSPATDDILRGNRKKLPELKSDTEPCEPGKKYRYKCNTCSCNKKGVPSCTTMICLDFYDTHTGKKEDLKDSEKKVHDIHQLPEIHEGEPCTHGVTYRLDCNACLCNKGRLICTKKLCLRQDEVNEQKDFEKHKADKKPIETIFATKNKNMFLEVFDDKLVIHQRKDKKKHAHLNSSNSSDSSTDNEPKEHENVKSFRTNEGTTKHTKNKKVMRDSDDSKEALGQGSARYPKLPATKCKPGHLYSKDCQRCFCTHKQVARCTNRPCAEMKGPALLPKDVFPHIYPKEIATLPTLPHQAARCKAGMVYLVDCNICLCIFNGNLFCQNKLCPAMGEVNKIAAQKHNGKRCHMKNGALVADVTSDCITCVCVHNKLKCQPLENCMPFRFRRQLHGELHPRVAADKSIDKGDKCTPGMVYKEKCNNCYCQEDGSLRCTRKGCLTFDQVQKLQKHRARLLKMEQ
ncbi:pacifastin inhibitor (LCMII) domain-containing protein [Phthorimaea operculella]|nr:pacifastin inhibitor (LCMII) domain-containing protein [Phthorimaea operculella]